MRILTLFLAIFSASIGFAQYQSQVVAEGDDAFAVTPIKRLVVFPFKVDRDLQKVADEVWWDMREKLTDNKRFLIASKNFMEVKDVFQPRGALIPSDAIILGRLLESHGLITTFVRDNELSMQAYETRNGTLLWQKKIVFHPSTPVSKQLPDAASKLILDFIASVPYQGSVILDSISTKPLFSDNGKTYFRADVGVSTTVTVGSVAQVIRLLPKSLKPQYDEGTTVDIIAEGTITKVDGNVATIEVKRRRDGADIRENDLVRLPGESKRLQQKSTIDAPAITVAGTQLLTEEGDNLTEKEKQSKPLVTALGFIGSLVTFILLAF